MITLFEEVKSLIAKARESCEAIEVLDEQRSECFKIEDYKEYLEAALKVETERRAKFNELKRATRAALNRMGWGVGESNFNDLPSHWVSMLDAMEHKINVVEQILTLDEWEKKAYGIK